MLMISALMAYLGECYTLPIPFILPVTVIMSFLFKGEPNYENVAKLQYLDMCLKESLRLFPPGLR